MLSVALEVAISTDMLIAYTAIVIMALLPIYFGAHLSVGQTETQTSEKIKNKDTHFLSPEVERMSSDDALKFPLIGSGVLFGLYLLFKTFSQEWINFLLTAYFLAFGVAAVGSTVKPLLAPFFPKMNPWNFEWMPFWKPKESWKLSFDLADVASFFVGVLVGVWYALTKNWISNNILGFAFSVQGVAWLSLGTYKVGCILLSGLFLYDIFWVFGTEVMVVVAKSFDAPIKLLFPKSLFAEQLQFSMLGLGDIVIPGIFIALLLRFDVKRAGSAAVSKTYFWVCFVAYTLGLVMTIFIMHTFQAAQPALLYLVPACIGSSFSLAVVRGEVGKLLSYSEEHPEKKKEQ